jgi:signal transduction histidine kinase
MKGHARFYNCFVALPWRRLRVMTLGGIAAALLAMAGGRLIERIAIGGDQAAAVTRVERDVRTAFDQMSRRLAAMGAAVGPAETIRAAEAGDTAAASALFSAAAAAIEGEDDVALTVYAIDGQPIAWAGRPSELGTERLQGAETWFLAQGPLGLRLVYVRPVESGSSRAAMIAVERPVPLTQPSAAPGLRDAGADAFQFPTRVAPVSIFLPAEGTATRLGAASFSVATPSGAPLLTASLSEADVDATRRRWRRATRSIAILLLAAALALTAAPLLDARRRIRRPAGYTTIVVAIALIAAAARGLVWLASPADWLSTPLFSGVSSYASTLLPLFGSPFDFLVTMLVIGAIAGLALSAAEAWRIRRARLRHAGSAVSNPVVYLALQILAGVAVALVLAGHRLLVQDTVAQATIDLLQFSLRPFSGARLALQVGLVIAHASAIGLGVAVVRAAWNAGPRHHGRWPGHPALPVICWIAPFLIWQVAMGASAGTLPGVVALLVVVAVAMGATRAVRRYRRGSQAFRLSVLALTLVLPSWTFYPTVYQLARRAKIDLVERLYAPQALNQRQTVQTQMKASLDQIDGFPGLADLLAIGAPAGTESSTGAFQVWQSTALAAYPVTSSVELYGPDRMLVSRFAFNLPEDLATPLSEEQQCTWELYEGVASFFAEERRVLHAGRQICAADPAAPPLGSVVVRAILDYENLPFIYSKNPYVELMRPSDPLRDQRLAGRDVEYAVYGWSRAQLYQSGDTPWPLPDAVFARVERSRDPLWGRVSQGGRQFDLYLQNDRGGIYALGFPVVSLLGHLVNLAEVTVLSAAAFLLLLSANALFRRLGGRISDAPALLREVRASFYRRLFIAFILAVFVPVLLLALVTRNYVANQMRASIEQEAVRTASAARRVVEDLVGPRAARQGTGLDDNLMVWVSRLIDQDVNVFSGSRLQATSERNLFESGLLPTRTPAPAYHALELRRQAAAVTTERIGASEYLVAAAPLTLGSTLLSVPLTSRQREIDQEIENLDRRVLLSVLLFMLAGAGIGYSMAERISDPVSRLTRATRRIARGELDTRIVATSTDELGRLVEDFNSMARELQRQRGELERTHRLEAWAEMARQVAHDIKNPLTPIQLNAEHLRRVHGDRGRPLGPVLDEAVDTILSQVKLLRQIASEFSSFASSPTARPSSVDVTELLGEVLSPYRTALAGRIRFAIDVPQALPRAWVDRSLVARALTNVIENALHAMPGDGALTVVADHTPDRVRIRVSDTGAGMDAEALARAFEPYFSTKATGTGLGLPIARRNIELNGGTVSVSSEREVGTAVEMLLPIGSAVGATHASPLPPRT